MSGLPKESILDRRVYKQGQVIFSQGDPGEAAYVVASGAVDIVLTLEQQVIKLGTIKQGEIFGEMAVVDGGKRMASAIAAEATTVIRVPKQVFEEKLERVDPFVRALINIFLNNIRNAHKVFIRKPRSFSDYLKVILSFSSNLRTYTNYIEVSDYSIELAAKLAELDKVIADLNELSLRHKDRRSDRVDVHDLEIGSARSIKDPEILLE